MSTTADDVATSLGRSLTVAEAGQVQQWIGDAELQIRLRLGDIDALDPDALEFVTREAVLERLRNPDVVDEEAETIDDYTRSWKRSGTKRVTIWPEWWEMLSPTRAAEVFSARPASASDYTSASYWWDNPL